ncbi:MAG TPA: hypothetical protein VK963_01290, partial [Candidatus Saccharimonadales bacterium]|nr:hypothetical protein [Candidatus Saccharimonadales bacterium]
MVLVLGSVVSNLPALTPPAQAVASGDGKIIYGEGTVTTPRTRDWTNSSSSFGAEGSLPTAAASIRHTIVKASPTSNEMIVGIQATDGSLYIQRWNGTSWSSEWSVTAGDGNLPRFDIAYEQSSGQALVVYTGNVAGGALVSNELRYRVWNGSTWTAETNLDTAATTGIVDAIALEPRSGTNEIALTWGDRNFDLAANYWDGADNTWKGEPLLAIATSLSRVGTATTLTNWSFDLAFESTSGELLISFGVDADLDGWYMTRGAGPTGAWGVATENTSFVEEGTDIELSSDPNSDFIAYANATDNGADCDAAIWTGTAWQSFNGYDITCGTVAAGTSNNSINWVTSGSQTRAILAYDEGAAGIDWLFYNKNTAAWSALQTDQTSGSAANETMMRMRPNPFNGAELMQLEIDANSDLFASKWTFDGTNINWARVDGGAALELTASSITGFAADFAYNKFIPALTIEQAAYRLFNNADSTDVGAALAAQNTAATLSGAGDAFRLRMLMHIGGNDLVSGGQQFKLQFAPKGAASSCVGVPGGDFNAISIGGADWAEQTSAAGWSGRTNHTSLAYNSKMWVIGGFDGTSNKNDVWSSSDGITWTQETSAAGWSARNSHTSLGYNNKMWVIGGFDGTNRKNDVWSSSDGITWTQETSSAGWSGRTVHTSLVYNNKMWVIGGFDGSHKNDVWSSSDGITWTQETSAAPWIARLGHTSLVFNNKMWVIGGSDSNTVSKNDVWSSSDGIAWTQETSAAGWSARDDHASLVFNNKMWVIGGSDGSNKNDVWSSSDGITWTQVTSAAGWSGRTGHTSLAYNNKMWVIGGEGTSNKNDVWSSAASVITFNDNAAPADAAALTANANDPTHGSDTIVNQTYEEANNFTSTALIAAGQDGKWDFSLLDNGAPAATTYCFRAVKSDGSQLTAYSVMPQITTAGTAGNASPASPSTLAQKKTTDTVIATGGWTNETSVKFAASASDSDNPEQLQL